MDFVKYAEKDEKESRYDMLLLALSNYLFVNKKEQSRAYMEIVRSIQDPLGDETILTIADRVRPLVPRSAALSQLSSETKSQSMLLLKKYSKEIFQSPPLSEENLATQTELQFLLKEYSAKLDTSANSLAGQSQEKDHTDSDLVSTGGTKNSRNSSGPGSLADSLYTDDSGVTDQEIAEMAYFPTQTVEIKLTPLEQENPSEDDLKNAIILLGRYIRTNSEQSLVVRRDMSVTSPQLLSKLRSVRPDEVQLDETELTQAFKIALKYQDDLNEFQNLSEDDKYNSLKLDFD